MSTNAADSTSPKTAPSHPPIQQMVDEAIGALKQRNGSSLFAIKKYITANYDADVHKLDPYIKKYLKKSVVNGKFHQAKGKGASGSFKFSALAKKEQLKAEELAMMKKKKSLSPVKPKTKLNIKTSDKLKASLKSKAVSKPEVDVKAKSMKREKDRSAVAKLLKTDVAKMKAWENDKAKQTNGDVKSPKGKQSKKQYS